MAYWLIKSEPFKYSWDQLVSDGRTHWNGVRNYQAFNNLKAMRLGDQALFYHSNEGLAAVGIATVVREVYPDPTDEAGRFGMVDFAAHCPLPRPVTLAEMKADPLLQGMALVRQSRLSVCPVTDAEWRHVLSLSGLNADAL
jgi:predicted RNA-binding protein with PUA-like domain